VHRRDQADGLGVDPGQEAGKGAGWEIRFGPVAVARHQLRFQREGAGQSATGDPGAHMAGCRGAGSATPLGEQADAAISLDPEDIDLGVPARRQQCELTDVVRDPGAQVVRPPAR